MANVVIGHDELGGRVPGDGARCGVGVNELPATRVNLRVVHRRWHVEINTDLVRRGSGRANLPVIEGVGPNHVGLLVGAGY